MDQERKNKVHFKQLSAFRQIDKMHPVRMLLYLSMLGIGILFFILVVAFFRTGGFHLESFQMPKLFSVSTLLLLFSSFTLNRVPRFYRKDKLKKMARYLGFTLAFGVSFVIAQFIGWNEISASGVSFTGKASGTYLYLITALHIVHLLGGLIFLSYLFFKTLHVNADGVRSLIFIRDPYRILQLTMLNSYWNFMGFLWLGLYLVFLFLV